MHKSLLSSSLIFVFSIVAYATYVNALLNGNTAWMVVSALLYFFPVFTEFFEELSSMRFCKTWQLIGMIICVVCSVFCLVSMLVFLAIASTDASVHVVFKIILVVLPVTCIPIKAIPFIQAIYQWYNRSTDSPKSR